MGSGLGSSRGVRGEANYPKVRLQESRLMVRWWRLWSKKKAVEKEPFIQLNTFSEPSDRLSCDTLNSIWISVFLYSLPHLDTEI